MACAGPPNCCWAGSTAYTGIACTTCPAPEDGTHIKEGATKAALARHDIFKQLIKLQNILRHLMGEDLITHLGLGYYQGLMEAR
ncbi:hypothetical protein [Nibrella viscosa]|uniref:hypothetical protein n=1 Tax=Nibrella viscosa TaxID=1084524 RepID=UPI0031E897CA